MNSDEKLTRIRHKVEWAKKHLADLQLACQAFLDTDPYAVGAKENAETGQTELYLLRDAEVPPIQIGLIAGDVAHNLRSALDHLAYRLCFDGTNGAGVPDRRGRRFRHVQFPIFDSANEYTTPNIRPVEGMTDDAKNAIAATEPYQGGKGHTLWILHSLDVADKHHALVTADIRAQSLAMDFTLGSIKNLYPNMPDGFRVRVARFSGFDFPGFRAPAKAGEVIATFKPNVYKDVKPAFDISFSEPKVVEGESVVERLKHTIDFVDNLILGFRHLL